MSIASCSRSARTRRPTASSRADGVRVERLGGARSSSSSARRSGGSPSRPSSTSTISCGPATSRSSPRSSTTPRRRRTTSSSRYDLLKNANIAAGGVLPMCQDTGTAIVMGKKGRRVWTDGDDEERDRRGHPRRLPEDEPALLAGRAALDVRGGATRASTCRRRSTSMPRARTPTSSCSSPRAAARPTRPSSTRRRRRC